MLATAGVPGTVAGLIHAQERYGKLTLKQVIQPAIDLADKGFKTSLALHMSLSARAERLAENAEAKRIYLQGGEIAPVPGTGILVNNEMDDFAAKAGDANAYGLVQGEANTIAPGPRPLSSMTPTIVFKDGQPWLAASSPGGSLIITTVLQTLLNAMVFDMNIAAAVAAPRVHNQWMPDRTLVEPGISVDTQRILEGWGHSLATTRRTIGRSNSLMIDEGWMQGFADMRRPGGTSPPNNHHSPQYREDTLGQAQHPLGFCIIPQLDQPSPPQPGHHERQQTQQRARQRGYA